MVTSSRSRLRRRPFSRVLLLPSTLGPTERELMSKKLSMGVSGKAILRAATNREPGDRCPRSIRDSDDFDIPIFLASSAWVIPASRINLLKRSGENLFKPITSCCHRVTPTVYGRCCYASTQCWRAQRTGRGTGEGLAATEGRLGGVGTDVWRNWNGRGRPMENLERLRRIGGRIGAVAGDRWRNWNGHGRLREELERWQATGGEFGAVLADGRKNWNGREPTTGGRLIVAEWQLPM